jgi:hypothetical protein
MLQSESYGEGERVYVCTVIISAFLRKDIVILFTDLPAVKIFSIKMGR